MSISNMLAELAYLRELERMADNKEYVHNLIEDLIKRIEEGSND